MARRSKECACPLFELLSVFEQKWALAIVKELHHREARFNQLKAAIRGITPAMLSDRLALLESKGLVERHIVSRKPVVIEYGLSKRAREALSCWGG